MKKLFSSTLLSLLLAGFSVCQAISPDRMNAGGVYIDQGLPEVVAIYGEPVSAKTEQVEAGFRHTQIIYEYGRNGTTFNITFVNERVKRIYVAGNNGIATSDGIKVGTPLSEVKRILGPGKDIKSEDGTKHRVLYQLEEPGDPDGSLNFYIKDNKVQAIYVDSGLAI